MSRFLALVAFVSFIVLHLVAECVRVPANEPIPAPHRFALLVGCTVYEQLPPQRQLTGPANDVVEFRKLLVNRFGFSESDVVTLSEAAGKTDANRRPTRANIMRELKRLENTVGRDDQVVLLLSGHGSQQPDTSPYDEVDGMDEIFLPADAGPWNGQVGIVKNAIVDDELNDWAKRVTDRGAKVTAICDCCHSGTMLRDAFEVAREVTTDDLKIPVAAIKAASDAAKERFKNRKDSDESLFKPGAAGQRSWVALYAAMPEQATPERLMPPGREPPNAKPEDRHGLFSYTICQVLQQTEKPISYRELHQRIQSQYARWDLPGPTPLIEGNAVEREVFGTKDLKERPKFQLVRGEDGGWQVNAGRLHGLASGTILAVMPDAGAANADKPLGHVRVTADGAAMSPVAPCPPPDEFRAPPKLAAGMPCKPVQTEYGTMKLRVAVDPGAAPAEQVQQLRSVLTQGAGKPDTLFELSPLEKAHWVAQIRDGQAVLRPAEEAAVVRQSAKATPPPLRKGLSNLPLTDELAAQLQRIAGVRSLIELTSTPIPATEEPTGGPVDVRLSLIKYRDDKDPVGQPITNCANLVFQPGDQFDWKVKNVGRNDADVTVLYIDSGYRISAVFPTKNTTAENRLSQNNAVIHKIPANGVVGVRGVYDEHITVGDKATGREYLVVIAVKGDDRTSTSFSWLADFDQGRRSSPKSPLERILNAGVFGDRTVRGVPMTDARQSTLQLVSWEVKPVKN